MSITKDTLSFLRELDSNNNKEWFTENKHLYTKAHENVVAFTEKLLNEVSKIDHIVPKSPKRTLFRIYRDVRFSKDKTPHKNYFSGSITRATAALRGGYYFSIQPGQSFVGGGFYQPNKEDLARIRYELAHNADPFRKVINQKAFKTYFGEMLGDQVKTAPKGYKKDDPNIDLLRFKSMYFMHGFNDKEVTSKDFEQKMIDGFKKIRPFFDLMSDVLTTDKNGVSII